MRSFTFKVEDVFQIDGRALLAVPGLQIDDQPNVFPGDPLSVVPPEETSIKTTLASILMVNTIHKKYMPVILPTSFTKSDIPTGSTITVSQTRKRDDEVNHSIYEIGDRVTVEKTYRNKTPRTGTIDRKSGTTSTSCGTTTSTINSENLFPNVILRLISS